MVTNDDSSGRVMNFEPDLYRRAISLFATGVAVISSRVDEGLVHGMTVNSFTSISLDPPTVMISLKDGKMHQLISEKNRYGVSVLSEEQRAHSSHYGGRPDSMLNPEFLVREDVPILKNCLSWFECEVVDQIKVVDHTLFISRVLACGYKDLTPLVFYSSKYQKLMINS